MQRLIVSEIKADAKQFGDARRTLIEVPAPVVLAPVVQELRPITVILSKNGWIRGIAGHEVDAAGLTFKAGDSLLALVPAYSTWPIVLLSDSGRTFSLTTDELTPSKEGVPISALRDTVGAGAIQYMLCSAPDVKYLLAQSAGYGFIAELSDMVTRQKTGKAFMTLEQGERMLPPAPVVEAADQIAAWSNQNRLLLFSLTEMKILAKGGRGVQVMGLGEDDALEGVRVRVTGPVTLEGVGGKGNKPLSVILPVTEQAKFTLRRARKGAAIPKLTQLTSVH
jgi:topoisomerase-4 subunit A